MANYTAANAMNYIKEFIKNPPVTANSLDVISADMAQSKIWISYPWRWTLNSLTSIALVDGTQDYTIGDADFYRPVNLWITRTDLTPDEYKPLKQYEFLPPELSSEVGWPRFESISWEKSINKLRLEAAANVPTGVTLRIDGDYQKTPTKITAMATALVSPDWYFEAYVDMLLYYMYKFTDDSRTNDQFGKAMESLRQMIAEEDRGNGVPLIFPDEPIVGSNRYGTVSIFG